MSHFEATASARNLTWFPAGLHSPLSAGRRRLAVFATVFAALTIVGLAYDFSRPAEYRSAVRLQIVFPGQGETADERRAAASAAFLTEAEILTSSPLVELTLAELQAAGRALPAQSGDAVEAYRRMLDVRAIPGTAVVELSASGREPEVLAPLLNGLVETYRRQLSARYRDNVVDERVQAQDEAATLAARVADKRRELEAFRARHDIVSLEREENQALSQVKGLGAALNAANEKAVAAEGRLRSLREALAAGKGVVRARDNPTLSNLEQRASMLREELRDMERRFTPDFLAFDPQAKALRARLADVERQLQQAREGGQQAALREAEEELAAARAAVERLSQQAANDRRSVQAFTARLEEFEAMRNELARLEEMQQATLVRTTGLEAGQRGRAPTLHVLEPAVTPDAPWRPQYWRDAGVVVAGALLLALFATWVAELFRRPEPGPSVVVAPAWLPAGRQREARTETLAEPAIAALPGALALPRELDERELRLLLAELGGEARVAALGLLSGVSFDELTRLRWPAVDLDTGLLHLPDRTLPLSLALYEALSGDGTPRPDADAPLLPAVAGNEAVGLDEMLLYAAHDAGIANPAEVTSDALRHSYIAWLVRQGVRFVDLLRLVGRLPADALAPYAALAPAGRKLPLESIDPVHPALRPLAVEGER